MASMSAHYGTGALLVFGCGFLQLCRARQVPCYVILDDDRTTYSVPEVKATGCEFLWAKNGTLLGTGENFTSSECFRQIQYQRTCTSEKMESITASCVTNCSKTCNCTVTRGADRTTFSVPEVKATGCEFSWTNASDTHHHVLGDQEKEDPLVNISSFTSLKCVPLVDYERKCASEPFGYTASCLTNCSEMEVGSNSWIALVIITVILVVLLLLLSCFLGYKYRSKVLEWICAYSPVSTGATDKAEN